MTESDDDLDDKRFALAPSAERRVDRTDCCFGIVDTDRQTRRMAADVTTGLHRCPVAWLSRRAADAGHKIREKACELLIG